MVIDYYEVGIKKMNLLVSGGHQQFLLMQLNPITQMVKYIQNKCESTYRQMIEVGTNSDRMMALNDILVSNQQAQANMVKLYRDMSYELASSKLIPFLQKIPSTY